MSRTLSRGFDTWSCQTAEARVLKVNARKVLQKWLNETLCVAFAMWEARARRQQEIKAKASGAAMMLLHRQLSSGFKTWLEQIAVRKVVQAKTRNVVQRILSSAQIKALAAWQQFVSNQQVARRVVRRMLQTMFARTYWQWCEYVENCREIKSRGQRILQQIKRSTLLQGFQHWRLHACKQAHMNTKTNRALQRLSNACLFKSFAKWQTLMQQIVLVKKWLKGILSATLARGMTRWFEHTVEAKGSKVTMHRVLLKLRKKNVLWALELWRDAVECLQEERQTAERLEKMIRRVLRKWYQSALCSMFEIWLKYTLDLKEANRQQQTAIHSSTASDFNKYFAQMLYSDSNVSFDELLLNVHL